MHKQNLVFALGIASLITTNTQFASAASSTLVSINVQGADLNSLMALISQQANINIVVDGDAGSKQITLRLNKVPLQTALDSIERAYGLSQATDHGIIHIGDPGTLARMFPNSPSQKTVAFPLANADPTFVAQTLTAMLPQGTVVVADPRTSLIYVKGDSISIEAARNEIQALDVARTNMAGHMSNAIPLSNIKASDALTILKTELQTQGAETLAASDHPNVILVNGPSDFIAQVKGMLFDIDRPGKQVRFKVRVADITPINDNSSIGVLLGGPPSGSSSGGSTPFVPGVTSYAFVNKAIPIFATLQALETSGHGRILAEPQISTLNNEQAKLQVGEQYPISVFNPATGQNQVQFISAGVNLTMTPIIGDDNEVTISLDTDYSQILSFVGSYPVVGQRHVTDVFRVKNDEAIVIAGLFSDITSDTVQKIPILGNLPFGLGAIFSNRTKTHTRDEIVFIITPHIITPNDAKPTSSIKDSLP